MDGTQGIPEEATLAALAAVRRLIDGVDDGFLLLFAGRRRLVLLAAWMKREAGRGCRDREREQQVRMRARRIGRRLGLPDASSERLVQLLVADALRLQGLPEAEAESRAPDLDQGSSGAVGCTVSTMATQSSRSRSWLRWLPPPRRLRPLFERLPSPLQARFLEAAMANALAVPLAEGRLDALEGRRIGIEVEDLGLRWVIQVRGRAIHVCPPPATAEATVRGSATDLLLLASRREDADTLFFQRRLVLTGDVELGLTARNLLDQLPWEQVPLGLRIAMHRGAGLLSEARAAWHARA